MSGKQIEVKNWFDFCTQKKKIRINDTTDLIRWLLLFEDGDILLTYITAVMKFVFTNETWCWYANRSDTLHRGVKFETMNQNNWTAQPEPCIKEWTKFMWYTRTFTIGKLTLSLSWLIFYLIVFLILYIVAIIKRRPVTENRTQFSPKCYQIR